METTEGGAMKAAATLEVLTSAWESNPTIRLVALDMLQHQAKKIGWDEKEPLDVQELQYTEDVEGNLVSITRIAGLFDMEAE